MGFLTKNPVRGFGQEIQRSRSWPPSTRPKAGGYSENSRSMGTSKDLACIWTLYAVQSVRRNGQFRGIWDDDYWNEKMGVCPRCVSGNAWPKLWGEVLKYRSPQNVYARRRIAVCKPGCSLAEHMASSCSANRNSANLWPYQSAFNEARRTYARNEYVSLLVHLRHAHSNSEPGLDGGD